MGKFQRLTFGGAPPVTVPPQYCGYRLSGGGIRRGSRNKGRARRYGVASLNGPSVVRQAAPPATETNAPRAPAS